MIRNWKTNFDVKLQAMFDEIVELARSLDLLHYDVEGPFIISSDVRSWGICEYTKEGKANIGINPRTFSNDFVVRTVLVHEIAHACLPYDGHSAKWKLVGDKIGSRYGITVSRTNDYSEFGVKSWEDVNPPKYIIRCPGCGFTWGYHRMSQCVRNPNGFRCGKCHTKLVRDL